MHFRSRLLPVLLATACTLTLPACGTGDSDSGNLTEVESGSGAPDIRYRFADGPIEPDSQRNSALTIEDDEARIVVDSYGDILHDVTEPITHDDVERVLTSLYDLEARSFSCDQDGGMNSANCLQT